MLEGEVFCSNYALGALRFAQKQSVSTSEQLAWRLFHEYSVITWV